MRGTRDSRSEFGFGLLPQENEEGRGTRANEPRAGAFFETEVERAGHVGLEVALGALCHHKFQTPSTVTTLSTG
jgi:hypothetical protein